MKMPMADTSFTSKVRGQEKKVNYYCFLLQLLLFKTNNREILIQLNTLRSNLFN